MNDELDDFEYIKAIAKAMSMPDAGLAHVSIEWKWPGPVMIKFEYMKRGEPALMTVLPKKSPDEASVMAEMAVIAEAIDNAKKAK